MAVGGGTKNPLWMQMTADITGKTLHTAGITIGASFGDAMMAAMGIRYFDSFADFSSFIKAGAVYTPDMQAHQAYQPYLRIFDELYEATKELMHRL